MAASSHATALRVLSLAMGLFLLFMGLDKVGWFEDAGLLTQQLHAWRVMAGPLARWYLDTIALPGAPVFARIVPAAELAAGSALLLGVGVRLAAALACLLVINVHVAAGVMFRYDYLWNAYGPPVLGALLALAIGGARLPFSAARSRGLR